MVNKRMLPGASRVSAWLQGAANLAVIVASLCVVWLVWDRFQHPAPSAPQAPPAYAVGQQMDAIDGVSFQDSPQTLLMALREDCRYCQDSVPFYQKLTAGLRKAAQGTTRLVVLSTDTPGRMSAYLESNDVHVDKVVTYRAGTYKIPGTPSLFLIDRTGTVQRVWRGRLPKPQEEEVFAVFGLMVPK